MTFDSVSFQYPLTELVLPQNERRIDEVFVEPQKIKISNRHRAPKPGSPIKSHIDHAEVLFDAGKFEAAYEELEAATERFLTDRESINQTLDQSIAYLTTLGCRATPPHPVAIPLIRLRRKITA